MLPLILAAVLCAEPYETVVKHHRLRDAAADATALAIDDAPLALDGVVNALEQIPGLQMTRLGSLGAPLWVSLRGSSTAQVAVFFDGVPLGGLAESSVDLNDLPWGDVDRVEVYRGVSPLYFGTGAIGGVLAFNSRVPTEDNARLGLGYGSFNTFGGDFQAASHIGSVNVHGGVHAIASDGDFWFRSDGGTAFTSVNNQDVQRLNNALQQGSVMVGSHWQCGPHRLRTWLWGVDRESGVPSLGIRQALSTHLSNQQWVANVAYRLLQANLGQIEAQAYATFVRQRYDDPYAEVTPYPSHTDDRSGQVGLRGYGSWNLVPGWQVSSVAHLRFDSLSPSDSLAQPSQGATSTRWWMTVGAESDVLLGPVHLLPSVLVEGAVDERAGRDPFGHYVSAQPYRSLLPQGRVGAWQALDDSLSWRTNLARYARLPSALELYGDAHGILGNTALVPETGINADVGARFDRAYDAVPWRIEVVGFAAFSQDLITFEQNAVGLARAINLGQGRILGVDASTQVLPTEWLQVTMQATFMDARDVSATPQGRAAVLLPNRPRWHVFVQPQFNFCGIHANVNADYAAGAFLDPANLVALPDRLVFGASVGWHVCNVDIALRAQNILDGRFFDVAGYPLPSRSLMLTLRLQSSGET